MDTFDLTGKELAGYRLVRRLGSGGMATVYYAENLLQPTIVRALKVVHPTLAVQDDFLKRFAEEARNLERLAHPNVVRFYGLRQDGPHQVMELELLQGRTLAEVLEESRRRGVPAEQAIQWMHQAASGVAAAHALGVVHRDLKPENLYLTEDGDVKVLDFGIARARDESERATRLTAVGTVTGTAGYLAPEAWEAGDAGPPSDVYALGLTLAEMLLGHHPFMPPDAPRPSRVQLMHAHITRGLPDLREFRDDLKPGLLEVIATATAQDPSNRYPSASEFAVALETVGAPAGTDGPAASPAAPAPPAGGSYTELALPTRARAEAVEAAATAAAPAEAAAAAGPKRSWKAWVGAAGALVLLGGGALWALVSSPDEGTPTPEGPLNPWVDINVPEQPIVLGLPGQNGVGFWPDAEVRSPTVNYALQQYEVTWAELDPFLDAHPEHAFELPSGVPDAPATRAPLAASGVPWATADAYCRSLGEDAALPTEEQWEFAARGIALRPYAWGDRAPDPLRTKVFADETWSVKAPGSSPQDRTPGAPEDTLWDLMGNAREWTADPFRVATSGVTPPGAASSEQTMRAVRGLPLKPHPQGETYERPRVGAAWRKALCGTGSCLGRPTLEGETVAAARAEVGLRCSRERVAEVTAEP